ncbi:MAG: phage terminase large subunit [Paraclostridium sp.]
MTKFVSSYSTSYYQVPSPTHERLFREKISRHTHLTGAVRTGKTRLAVVWFIQHIFLSHKIEPGIQKNYCIIAKSRASLLFNILNNLHDWLPHEVARQFPTSQNSFGCFLKGNKITIRYFPVDDERALSRLMGSSLQGILIDEVSYLSMQAYAKVTSRLTGIKESRFEPFILTTSNPDSISHWLNQTHILPAQRQEIDAGQIRVIHFMLNKETCPFLPEQTIEGLINDFKNIPTLYKRNVLGIWCSAQGAVFGMLDETHLQPDISHLCTKFILGIDFGYVAPTACVLLGILPRTYFGILRVIVVDNAQFTTSDSAVTTGEYRAQIIEKMVGQRRIEALVYDHANPEQAHSLEMALRARGIYIPFFPCEKNIKESVELLLLSIASKRLVFAPQALLTFNVFVGLQYDEKERDKIVVAQMNDHLFDAVRYACLFPMVKEELIRRDYE